MRRIIYIVLLVGVCQINVLWSQQRFQSTLSMYSPYAHNIAYAGMDGTLSFDGLVRYQWQGLQKQPTTQYLTAHLPWYRWNGGLGMTLAYDGLGPESNIKAGVSYNYVYDHSLGLFSLGAGYQFLQKAIDGRALRTSEGVYEDNTINHNDPILDEGRFTGRNHGLDLGLYFENDVLSLGVGVDGLFFIADKLYSSSYSLDRTINMSASYRYYISDMLWLDPYVYMKTNTKTTQWQTHVSATLYETYSAGLGFRGLTSSSADALLFTGSWRVNPALSIHYGFDLGISGLNTAHQNSHEILVKYNLNRPIGLPKKLPIQYNPRYLD